ncbi:Com family DNA-binding transcriptional regulator [Oleidesulfovibrio alaskensis]
MLAKGEVIDLEIKCSRCGTINHMRTESSGREAREAHSEIQGDTDRTCNATQRRGFEPHTNHAG